MTTPNEELVLKLRGQAYTSYRPDQLCDQAADLLQSQAERIKGLEYCCKTAGTQLTHWQTVIDEKTTEIYTLRAQLAEIAATEPSMIYHGRCVIDCGDSGHHDVTMLKMIARETKLFTRPMPAESKDAERYRWLRDYLISPSTHFDDLIVSADKAETLNGVIDAARAKGTK